MVVETRFADADFISNVLEAETVKASRLNQALSAVEDLSLVSRGASCLPLEGREQQVRHAPCTRR